jgi:hypothetical protein
MRYFKKDYSWDNFRVLITVFFEGIFYALEFVIPLVNDLSFFLEFLGINYVYFCYLRHEILCWQAQI